MTSPPQPIDVICPVLAFVNLMFSSLVKNGFGRGCAVKQAKSVVLNCLYSDHDSTPDEVSES